jgi:hypothetical protein
MVNEFPENDMGTKYEIFDWLKIIRRDSSVLRIRIVIGRFQLERAVNTISS